MRDLDHFSEGLSRAFRRASRALKPAAPFVFTYHHNDLSAYAPIAVAILDAQLECTATLACPTEMRASLHIEGTSSSVVDTVFVCRPRTGQSAREPEFTARELERCLRGDSGALARGGVSCSAGDLRCIAFGHVTRIATRVLSLTWERERPAGERVKRARVQLASLADVCAIDAVAAAIAGESRETAAPVSTNV
jgi:adenine-specific DNA methylase